MNRTDFFTNDFFAPYVRRLAGEPEATVTGHSYELVKGDVVPPNRGIFHVTGSAEAPTGVEFTWSLYLKICRLNGRAVSETYVDPTQREALFYQSELSRTMNGNLAVPECLGVREFEDDAPWVFLKEITGSASSEWSPQRYGLVARHLGQFQGEFLTGRPLPSEQWADRRFWLQSEHAQGVARHTSLLDQLAGHPLTEKYYRGRLGERVREALRSHDMLLDAAMSLPSTVIHGDLNPTNLIAVDGDAGSRTVVIDWDYWGIGQMGIDTCTLIACTSVHDPPRAGALCDVVEMMFEQYLAGLRDAGWRGKTEVVRFAVIGVVAFVLGVRPPPTIHLLLSEETLPGMEQRWNLPAAEIVEQLVSSNEYLLDLAEEALPLMETIRGEA